MLHPTQLLSQFGILPRTHRAQPQRPALPLCSGSPAQRRRPAAQQRLPACQSSQAGADPGGRRSCDRSVAGHHRIPGRNTSRAGADATRSAGPCARTGAGTVGSLRDSPPQQSACSAIFGQRPEVDESTKATWYRHWITLGFTAIEAMLASDPATGVFCHGDTPGLADCCLIPQIANSRRFDTPLDAFPTIRRIEQACLALDAFAKAAPPLQPDAT
jgi:hypothetical protein